MKFFICFSIKNELNSLEFMPPERRCQLDFQRKTNPKYVFSEIIESKRYANLGNVIFNLEPISIQAIQSLRH